MRQLRWWMLGGLTFLAVSFNGWLRQSIAVILCLILGIDNVNAIQLAHHAAVAATPPHPTQTLIAQDIFRNDGGSSSPSPPEEDIFRNDSNGSSTVPQEDLFNNDDTYAAPYGNSSSRNQIEPEFIDSLDRLFTDISYSETSNTDFNIGLRSNSGCNLSVRFILKNNQIEKEIISFESPDLVTCGASSFLAEIFPENKSFVYQELESQENLTYQITENDTLKVVFKDSQGNTGSNEIPIPENQRIRLLSRNNYFHTPNISQELTYLSLSENINQKEISSIEVCEGFNKICDYVSYFNGAKALMNIVAIPLIAASGGTAFAFGLGIDIALQTASWVCFSAFGGLPPLPSLGNTSGLFANTYNAATWGYDYVSGSISYSNILANNYNQLSTPAYCSGGIGLDWNSRDIPRFIKNIRDQIPFSECDRLCEQPHDETPSERISVSDGSITLTTDPAIAEVGQPVNVSITFSDPACAADEIILTSPTMTSRARQPISGEAACGGSFNFVAQVNTGYGCTTFQTGFSVKVESPTFPRTVVFHDVVTFIGEEGSQDYQSCYPRVYNPGENPSPRGGSSAPDRIINEIRRRLPIP